MDTNFTGKYIINEVAIELVEGASFTSGAVVNKPLDTVVKNAVDNESYFRKFGW